MSFLNIIRSLEFSSNGILKQNSLDGIFIGSGEKLSIPKNYIVLTDEGTKHIALNFAENIEIIEKPTLEKAKEIANKALECEGILAVGSGSVFDTAKYAAHLAGKKFQGYCTALSMNGYLSSTASLYDNGIKKSFKAGLPEKLYFDLEVIQNAPTSLTKAGLGDSLARVSAQNDCMLSHKLKGTLYPLELFDFRLPSEQFLLENFMLLEKRDDEFFLQLLENILFSGFAMHLFGSSVPASGGEHAMAHIAESRFNNVRNFWHGLQISAFTVENLRIQNQFKEHNPEIPKHDLKKIFKELKMPTGFESLGLTESECEIVLKDAIILRDRFGFLNLNKVLHN